VYTILTNASNGQLIGMYPWLKWDEVVGFFATRTKLEWRLSIKEVCCDMSSTMEGILSALFTNAKIVSDRFHVMKNVLEDIWAIRMRAKTAIKKRHIEEQNNHEAFLKKQAKEWDIVIQWRGRPKIILPLKKYGNWETEIDIVTRIIRQIRKRKTDWNSNQQLRWEIAKKIPELNDLIEWYEYMYKFWNIYDEAKDFDSWKQKINQWLVDWSEMRERIDEVGNFTKTIEKRLDTLCNYFISRHNNGFAEWLHSRIQRLISMSRWFVNKDYMIYRIIKLASSKITFH
jgi:transposase